MKSSQPSQFAHTRLAEVNGQAHEWVRIGMSSVKSSASSLSPTTCGTSLVSGRD